MNVSKEIIQITDKLKPVLVKIVPIEYLSKAKRAYMNLNSKNLRKCTLRNFAREKYEDGINLIGNIRGDSGLGQSCRLLADELEHSKLDFCIYEQHISEKFSMTNHDYDYKISEELRYNVNLIHISPNEFTISFLQLGKSVWDYRYNIAFWLWELEEFPEQWIDCISIIDEIWTPSEFVSESIRKVTDKPVYTIPYHVTAPADSKYDRQYFGLPDSKFLFLMTYDSGSMMERKNPIGTLEAFKKAFDKNNTEVGLVIKVSGDSGNEVKLIKKYLDGYENVYFITETLSKIEINSLISSVDVYVSLHRAEGFGLVLAEAMEIGTPTIATNWSANTEFMNTEVACMVDYTLVQLKKDIGPFQEGNRWAEPDINQASSYMQKLFEDAEYYNKIATNARKYIEKKLSMEKIADMIKKRIGDVLKT